MAVVAIPTYLARPLRQAFGETSIEMGKRTMILCALLSIFGRGSASGGDFERLVEKAVNDLQVKTAAHQGAWGFGKAERWDLNQNDGNLIFTFPKTVVTCRAQIIGSLDVTKGTWLWAWANENVNAPLARQSREVLAYGKKHKYKKLTEPEWACTEQEAWEMAAVATLLGKAQGAYRGPAGDVYVFLSFGEPKIRKR